MLKAIKKNKWLTVFSTLTLIFLLSLGTWQLQRMAWKESLIVKMNVREGQIPEKLWSGIDVDENEFKPVSVRGTFLNEKEIHLTPRYYKDKFGFHIITPFRLSDGSGIILVNRGWVPNDKREAASREDSIIGDELTVQGVLRKPDRKGLFTPDNSPEKNYWFWLDMPEVSRYVGSWVTPIVVQESSVSTLSDYPIRLAAKPEFRNDHLQYAITWYSLAIALVVIYFSYIRKNGGRHKNERVQRTRKNIRQTK